MPGPYQRDPGQGKLDAHGSAAAVGSTLPQEPYNAGGKRQRYDTGCKEMYGESERVDDNGAKYQGGGERGHAFNHGDG